MSGPVSNPPADELVLLAVRLSREQTPDAEREAIVREMEHRVTRLRREIVSRRMKAERAERRGASGPSSKTHAAGPAAGALCGKVQSTKTSKDPERVTCSWCSRLLAKANDEARALEAIARIRERRGPRDEARRLFRMEVARG